MKIFILIILIVITCLLLFGRAKADNKIAFRHTDWQCMVDCINYGYSRQLCLHQCSYDEE